MLYNVYNKDGELTRKIDKEIKRLLIDENTTDTTTDIPNEVGE